MAANSTSFKKGQSGNPGGRPKALAEVQELARAHTGENITNLMRIARDKKAPAQARVAANQAVLDRAWGKAGQSIDINQKPNGGYVFRVPRELYQPGRDAERETYIANHRPPWPHVLLPEKETTSAAWEMDAEAKRDRIEQWRSVYGPGGIKGPLN